MALRNLRVSLRLGAAALAVLGLSSLSAMAGGAAPALIVMAQADPDASPDDGQAGGTAALLIRVERLEDRLRALTGQVEQLQFQNKKLDDQMRKMQQDVDFRFQDLGRTPAPGGRPVPQKKSDAGEVVAPLPVSAEAGATPIAPVVAEAPKPARRGGDAFDPATNPSAPGAPKPLGTTAPSQPLPTGAIADSGQTPVPPPAIATAPHAPLDLTPNSLAAGTPTVPLGQEAALAPDAGARGTITPGNNGATGGIRGEYDGSLALYKLGQYDAAIEGFQTFVQKYPRERLVADATYFLGESYARQGRHREAAEQFLKLSTDYARSNRAPDALLHLGVALNALGAKEQACATYQEVDRKYPAASPDVRAGVERELKRARC